MTQEEYLESLEDGFAECLEISRRKNSDYAREDDAFLNFNLCEKLGICPAEEGILVRMTDKLQRVANLINKDGEVEDEKIEDTLNDLTVYSQILKIYLRQHR